MLLELTYRALWWWLKSYHSYVNWKSLSEQICNFLCSQFFLHLQEVTRSKRFLSSDSSMYGKPQSVSVMLWMLWFGKTRERNVLNILGCGHWGMPLLSDSRRMSTDIPFFLLLNECTPTPLHLPSSPRIIFCLHPLNTEKLRVSTNRQGQTN